MIRPRQHLTQLKRFPHDKVTRSNSLRLDLNEIVPHIEEDAFQHIIGQLQPWMFSAYPELSPLYEALSNHLGVSEQHLIITDGSDAGIRQVIEVFCDPGDEIIISFPTFGMYLVYSKLFNLSLRTVEYKEDFSIDINDFISHISERTKLICIANPNGAIGCVMSDIEIERITREASIRGVAVLLDETYIDYHRDEWTKRIDEFDNLVIVRSFSKAGGLAGLRVGYILSNPFIQEWLIKASPFMEVNSVAILAATYLLKNFHVVKASVESTKVGRSFLVSELRRMGFEVYAGEINFILVNFENHKNKIHSYLESNNVRVMDLSGKQLLNDYTRITVGPIEYMRTLIRYIEEALSNYCS